MNQLRGSVTAARRVHTPQVRFESGDRNQTSLTADKAVLYAQASRLGFSFSCWCRGFRFHVARLVPSTDNR